MMNFRIWLEAEQVDLKQLIANFQQQKTKGSYEELFNRTVETLLANINLITDEIKKYIYDVVFADFSKLSVVFPPETVFKAHNLLHALKKHKGRQPDPAQFISNMLLHIKNEVVNDKPPEYVMRLVKQIEDYIGKNKFYSYLSIETIKETIDGILELVKDDKLLTTAFEELKNKVNKNYGKDFSSLSSSSD